MKNIFKYLLSLITIGCLILFPLNVNAASATFKTTSSKSSVVVGNTFTVTVKVSSSSTLGSWEYTISYDSSIVSLVSGKKSVADPGNGSQKSQSYTYTFKAIKAGTAKISVKSYAAYGWDEKALTCSASGATVKVITKAQLEASYSKDNNLKSLSIDNAEITPSFSKDVTEYKVQLGANTNSINIKASANDSKARVSGTGTFEVTEGDNKFQITVTAENGSTKTYTLIASVVDPNPINVKDTNGNELVVVKRTSLLTPPTSYTETTAIINGQEVPAFTSEITKFTLVGLKDSEGNINLYIYENNKFTKYTELKLNEITILPITKSDNYKDYIKTKIKINGEEIEVYKYKKDSPFSITYALDTETGKENYYKYDSRNNTITYIDDEEVNDLNSKIKTYSYIILGLLGETVILFLLLIILLIKKAKENKRKKEKFEKAKDKYEKKEEITEKIEITDIETDEKKSEENKKKKDNKTKEKKEKKK